MLCPTRDGCNRNQRTTTFSCFAANRFGFATIRSTRKRRRKAWSGPRLRWRPRLPSLGHCDCRPTNPSAQLGIAAGQDTGPWSGGQDDRIAVTRWPASTSGTSLLRSTKCASPHIPGSGPPHVRVPGRGRGTSSLVDPPDWSRIQGKRRECTLVRHMAPVRLFPRTARAKFPDCLASNCLP
jgi:hypothetical protein